MHNHIGYIYLTCLHCAFSNATSNCLPARMHGHTGCICKASLHYVFVNASLHHSYLWIHAHTCYICWFYSHTELSFFPVHQFLWAPKASVFLHLQHHCRDPHSWLFKQYCAVLNTSLTLREKLLLVSKLKSESAQTLLVTASLHILGKQYSFLVHNLYFGWNLDPSPCFFLA